MHSPGSWYFACISRLARMVVPGLRHHVTQRGNRHHRISVTVLSRFHVPRFQSSLPGRTRRLVVFFRGRSKNFRTYFNIDIAATTGIGAVSAREIGRKPKLFDRVPAHLQGRKVDRSNQLVINRPQDRANFVVERQCAHELAPVGKPSTHAVAKEWQLSLQHAAVGAHDDAGTKQRYL